MRVKCQRSNVKGFPRGFSLVELLVVVSIMTIITSVVLSGQGAFNSQTLLTNLAYDMALGIREAQNYGLSVREVSPGSTNFNAGYGVHYDRSDLLAYVLFADTDSGSGFNRLYDGTTVGCTNECVREYTIRRGNSIERFCAVASLDGSEHCSDSLTNPITFLDIVYPRAESDASIKTNRSVAYKSARIQIISPKGLRRTIEATVTGQISPR